ncbi:hypothetical protein ACFPMF_04025 [Larkinella bovis]|uniref:DUF4440 domain-containing protein n=1 Tax=Larkinella bovis TaxID=683041 RepID=A0ABW0I8J8_9BACT
MKKPYLMLLVGGALSTSVFAQQTAPPSEETQRRLRKTETRTTTTALYPDRDSILVLLKRRMGGLHPGAGAAESLNAWFVDDAKITAADGSTQAPAAYQASAGKIRYQNYRVRKLEINEKTAQAVEVYTFSPVEATTTAPQTASVTSQLRKDPDGRWRITAMKITTK